MLICVSVPPVASLHLTHLHWQTWPLLQAGGCSALADWTQALSLGEQGGTPGQVVGFFGEGGPGVPHIFFGSTKLIQERKMPLLEKIQDKVVKDAELRWMGLCRGAATAAPKPLLDAQLEPPEAMWNRQVGRMWREEREQLSLPVSLECFPHSSFGEAGEQAWRTVQQSAGTHLPAQPGVQAQPVTFIFLGFPGAVKIKTPLNRELVATYEVTISVHDNASEVIDRSVSVPNGKGCPQAVWGQGLAQPFPGTGTALPRHQCSFWAISSSPTFPSILTSNIFSGTGPAPAPITFMFSPQDSFREFPRHAKAAVGMERTVCP